ncbi:MAG: 23S rRNA (adenine(2030)-N(6))-methyltransferase RlmJ [Rhodocyclaceae bacterium]|nr:23S rRNA (adenine(2030)-N(6))-methyltransferase RlmJ [Rhodocyclaceae bacterium]
MLSYRHAFHVGNHADVLKHLVLLQLLDHHNQKSKPYWYIDTHAGAGRYALDSAEASRNAEHADGIGRLLAAGRLPDAAREYVELVRAFNRDQDVRYYPGSPVIAMSRLRPDDRMRLFELHPTDVRFLKRAFPAAESRVRVEQAEGFGALRSILPPPSRRAIVLIDPPYEVRQDYRVVVETIKDALRRFPGGTYAVWYPRIQKTEAKQLPERLGKLGAASWLHVWLDVKKPAPTGLGMHGSGMFVINPPWTLPETLNTVMPALVDLLAQDDSARFGLESLIP